MYVCVGGGGGGGELYLVVRYGFIQRSISSSVHWSAWWFLPIPETCVKSNLALQLNIPPALLAYLYHYDYTHKSIPLQVLRQPTKLLAVLYVYSTLAPPFAPPTWRSCSDSREECSAEAAGVTLRARSSPVAETIMSRLELTL